MFTNQLQSDRSFQSSYCHSPSQLQKHDFQFCFNLPFRERFFPKDTGILRPVCFEVAEIYRQERRKLHGNTVSQTFRTATQQSPLVFTSAVNFITAPAIFHQYLVFITHRPPSWPSSSYEKHVAQFTVYSSLSMPAQRLRNRPLPWPCQTVLGINLNNITARLRP